MNPQQLFLATIDPNSHDLAKRYGLGLEFSEFSTAWNLDLHFEETDLAIRHGLKSSDHFTMHGPFNELFPCAVDPQARVLAKKRFLQTIGVAQNYCIHKIILHAGFNPYLYYPCWFQEQSVIFWREFLPLIPDDMIICLENVLETTPQMLGQVIRELNDPRIQMCLDVGHANAYSQCSPFQWVEACHDIISHFHVHNNAGAEDSHSPLFQGSIEMEPLLRQIHTKCSQATITLELPDAKSSVNWLIEKKILEVHHGIRGIT